MDKAESLLSSTSIRMILLRVFGKHANSSCHRAMNQFTSVLLITRYPMCVSSSSGGRIIVLCWFEAAWVGGGGCNNTVIRRITITRKMAFESRNWERVHIIARLCYYKQAAIIQSIRSNQAPFRRQKASVIAIQGIIMFYYYNDCHILSFIRLNESTRH